MEDDFKEKKHETSVNSASKPDLQIHRHSGFGHNSNKHEEHHNTKAKKSATGIWAIVAVLVVVVILSILTKGFSDFSFSSDDSSDVSGSSVSGMTFTVLNDKNCKDCDPLRVTQVTQQLFPNIAIKEIDFNSKEGLELYKKYNVKYLPAFFFSEDVKDDPAFSQIESALQKVDGSYMINPQAVGYTYDPYAEVCDNGVDDNDNELVDCADSDCDGQLACMEKKATPKVDLFIMSHCPYGTQIEKGILPVLELLGNKIDFNLRFVHYAMHGETEVKEQLNQYCIQKEQNSKLVPYLSCFLKEGKGSDCLSEVKIDTDKLESCVKDVDEEYSVIAGLNDKSKWLGNFPPFNLDKVDAEKYGVQGSPTLVLNGQQVTTGRDSASLLKTICFGFDEKPKECDEELSSANPSPGFGYNPSAGNAASGSCG